MEWRGKGRPVPLKSCSLSSAQYLICHSQNHFLIAPKDGADSIEVYFVSKGTTNLDIFDDSARDNKPNEVILNCADLACTVLS